MTQNVHDISSAILNLKSPMSLERLQNILFYACGEYAALTMDALFLENILMSQSGPRVQEIDTLYQPYLKGDLIPTAFSGDFTVLNDTQAVTIEYIHERYGSYTDEQFSKLLGEIPIWKKTYLKGSFSSEVSLAMLIAVFRQHISDVKISPARLDYFFSDSRSVEQLLDNS
jgi:uncharacterized phage-associated protein